MVSTEPKPLYRRKTVPRKPRKKTGRKTADMTLLACLMFDRMVAKNGGLAFHEILEQYRLTKNQITTLAEVRATIATLKRNLGNK